MWAFRWAGPPAKNYKKLFQLFILRKPVDAYFWIFNATCIIVYANMIKNFLSRHVLEKYSYFNSFHVYILHFKNIILLLPNLASP